jgi:hypothetical protein
VERITQKDLEAVCARINRTVNGAELEPYERVNGHFRQVPNAFTISYAYGGAALHRNCDAGADGESHGVSDVFGYHMPKRELYERMQAFLRGVEVCG